MNMQEYEDIRHLDYEQYCAYLQQKYGIGTEPYMTEKFSGNSKASRTIEGLFAHHKMEDHVGLLSDTKVAKLYPYDWQKPENIVYCDWLEHLRLHMLIYRYPAKDKLPGAIVGIGGVGLIVQELTEMYQRGWTPQAWRQNCYNRVAADVDVFVTMLNRFIIWGVKNKDGMFVHILKIVQSYPNLAEALDIAV